MANLNGKTPEQMAKEIVSEAVTTSLIEIDGVTSQKLDVLVRKAHLQNIEVNSSVWNKKRDQWRQEFIRETIGKLHKTYADYLAKREEQENQDYFKSLIKHGTPVAEAYKMAYNGTSMTDAEKETVLASVNK